VNQDVAVARSALISGDEQLRRTREALGQALGIDGEVGVAPGFLLEGLVAQSRQDCRPLTEGERRADLVAAEAQVEAAAQSRAQATAGYLPRVGLASNVGAFTTVPGPGRVSLWSVAAVLSVPIWEGGLRRGLAKERAGAEAAASVAAEARRRAVFFEIERARRGEEVARALMETAETARELAQRTDQLTRRSFEIGRATSLELVQTAVNLRQAELSLALREFEWVQARLNAFLTEASCR
jgi:outer membrane protein TolC